MDSNRKVRQVFNNNTGINKYVDDFNEVHIGKVQFVWLSGL